MSHAHFTVSLAGEEIVTTAVALVGLAPSHWLADLPFERRLAKRHTGFVVLAITFLGYGTTELLAG